MVRKICQVCGKEYQAQRETSKYCSLECCHKGFSNKIEVQCEWCGKALLRAPHRIKRAQHQFCCSEHRQKWMTTITGENHPLFQEEKRICLNCGKEFLAKPSSKEKYCSLTCYMEHKKDRGNCIVCGKEVRRKGSKYCGQGCMGIDRQNRIKKTCSICGKKFERRPCEDKEDRNVCSVECANEHKRIYPAIYRQVMIRNLKTYPRETSIEKAIRKWLEMHNINHIPQYVVNSKFCVDFYLPEHNVIIEALGDYFHANPLKYGEGKKSLNEMQRGNIRKDKARFAYLRKCGYSVYGFWECDIRRKLDELMESVTELQEGCKTNSISIK